MRSVFLFKSSLCNANIRQEKPSSKPKPRGEGNRKPLEVITPLTAPELKARTVVASTSHASASTFPSISTLNVSTFRPASHPTTQVQCSQSRKDGKLYIHHFLKSCSPCMEHLFARFTDLGFSSVDVLNEVACNWTKDERLELLNMLPSHDVKVSKLEIFALERRFQRYRLEK